MQPAERRKNVAESFALARSEDVAVGGQNLFDERRARPWHTDNEDRRRVMVCGPHPLVQAGGAERFDRGVNKSAVPIA